MGATKRDDEAHMKYLKEDVDYDNKHGHSDEKMTADEKHISKLAGDLKYDEKKQGSPAKHTDPKKLHIHNTSSYAEAPSKSYQNADGSIETPKNKPRTQSSKTSTKSISEKDTSKLKNAFKTLTN